MVKMKPALYSSLLFSAYFFITDLFGGSLLLFFFVLICAAFGNIIYGIPVSLLSDYVTNKLPKC